MMSKTAPVYPFLAVDGSSLGNPGPSSFKIVKVKAEDSEPQVIVTFGPVHATNNLAEFIGLATALIYYHRLPEELKPECVYYDSRTAYAWVRDMKIKTTLERNKESEEIFIFVDNVLEKLKEAKYDIHILRKWDTNTWGEIPADFGMK